MWSKMIHRECNCSLKMIVNSSFILVSIRNYFIKECGVSCFSNIFVNSWEQPQSIISTVSRVTSFANIRCVIWSIFVTSVVSELNQWKSATVINLSRKHKADFFYSHFWSKVNYTLNVLNSVAVTVTIAKSTVNIRSCTAPCKSHETVVSVPCINHCVKFFARSLNLEVFKTTMPLINQSLIFLCTSCTQIRISSQKLFYSAVLLHCKNKCNFLSFTRFKLNNSCQSTTRIFVVACCIAQITVFYTNRIFISMISTKENILVTTERRNFCTNHCKYAVSSKLAVNFFFCAFKISVNSMNYPVINKFCAANEQRILKVYLILFIVTVVCKFSVTSNCKAALFI